MSAKEIKFAFSGPARAIENDLEPDATEPEGESGLYPRSLHILDFALTNLFGTAYAIPHTDKRRVLNDTTDPMTAEELEAYQAEIATPLGKTVSTAHILPNPTDSFGFSFNGVEDWSPCIITMFAIDRDGEDTEFAEAPQAIQEAFAEFMDDLSLATTNVSGVRVSPKDGTIEVHNPLSLFRVLCDMITWRNDETCDTEDALKMDRDDPAFPLEHRDIDLPQLGEHHLHVGSDIDLDEKYAAAAGYDFLYDDDTCNFALQNIPPRAYNSMRDASMALCEIRERLEYFAPMVRLDEMEAIIMQETRREKSYGPNPLLNLH